MLGSRPLGAQGRQWPSRGPREGDFYVPGTFSDTIPWPRQGSSCPCQPDSALGWGTSLGAGGDMGHIWEYWGVRGHLSGSRLVSP